MKKTNLFALGTCSLSVWATMGCSNSDSPAGVALAGPTRTAEAAAETLAPATAPAQTDSSGPAGGPAEAPLVPVNFIPLPTDGNADEHESFDVASLTD